MRERIDSATALAYVVVIVRHEASRLRKQSEHHRSLEQPQSIDGRACLGAVLADPRQVDLDDVLGVLDALRVAKPDHARAIARAEQKPTRSAGPTRRPTAA